VQKARPTQNKRARERARQEKQQQKAARRLEVKQRKANEPGHAGGDDPDIAGIVPGPQANPWGDEPAEAEEETS
jgi:hypothetical protein